MTRPGVNISVVDAAPPPAPPTATDAWFVTGITERGTVGTPRLVRSMTDYRRWFGGPVPYDTLADSLALFFADGGSRAWVSRVAGPAAVNATRALPGGAAASLTATAAGPGAYANTWTVEVAEGTADGSVRIIVRDGAGVLLDQSPDATAKFQLLAWGAASPYVQLVDAGPDELPAVLAPTALAGGTDDRANIVEADWTDAVVAFPVSLGPGQLSAPGHTTAAGYTQLALVAADTNRLAVADLADGAAAAAWEATVAAARAAAGVDGTHALAFYGGWLNVPSGLAGAPPKVVPPSALVAAVCSRVDALAGPWLAPAGDNAQSRVATGVTYEPDDDTRTGLTLAGVNAMRTAGGPPRVYGNRTAADPVTDALWLQVNPYRTLMAIYAEAVAVCERHLFRLIDGRGLEQGALAGDLDGVLLGFYTAGALHGRDPADAFRVNTGPEVNPPETLALGELHAVLRLRLSPAAELIEVPIVRYAITQELAA